MLNRKGNKASGAKTHRRSQEPAAKTRPVRHRFIISSKSAMQSRARTEENRATNGHSKTANGHSKTTPPQKTPNTLKTLKKGPMSISALIVDDSSVMRKIVERLLRQAGLDLAHVYEAGNGVEALGILKENRVDLILCDINMPVMNGLEFIKQLPELENAKGVPVVMITTEGSESHVVQALSCGAKGYIRKPFTPEQVKENVLTLLAGKT